MRRPFPPNNFCPCKSGQKYKKCCQPKKIEYFVRSNGQVVKEAILDESSRAEFLRQKEAFVAEHGRQPTEEEEGILRLSGGFADFSRVIEAELIKSGAKEEVLYAFRKTGVLVTRENESQVSPEELHRFEQAISEYRTANS
jgi:hypothetical protein